MYTIDDAAEDMRATFCSSCKEYKGMTQDSDGNTFCIFCE